MTVRRVYRVLLTTSLLFLAGCASEGSYPQTTFEPVSEFGRLVNRLFVNTFWWTLWIMLLVEVLILFLIFRYRARPDAPAPRQIHGHTGLEIAWTIIPAIIVLFIAIPTVAGIFATQSRASQNALQVEVIGHQWWWEFRYPQLGVVTANELVLPVGREVELKMWSADVVHSYWIPKIGGKRDVNPQPRTTQDERARYNYLVFNVEKPGYYLGQCAEFCGASHAIMRTSALALSETDFNEWARSMAGGMPVTPVQPGAAPQHGETAAEKVPGNEPGAREGGVLGAAADTLATPDSLRSVQVAQAPAAAPQTPIMPAPTGMSPTGAPAPGRAGYQSAGPIPPGSTQRAAMTPGQPTLEERGQQLISTKACVACHAINGTSMRGTLGPNLTRFGARRYVGAGARPNTMENVVAWIRAPHSIKPGALMPGSREGAAGMPPTGLTDDEINAIAAYLLSLK